MFVSVIQYFWTGWLFSKCIVGPAMLSFWKKKRKRIEVTLYFFLRMMRCRLETVRFKCFNGRKFSDYMFVKSELWTEVQHFERAVSNQRLTTLPLFTLFKRSTFTFIHSSSIHKE